MDVSTVYWLRLLVQLQALSEGLANPLKELHPVSVAVVFRSLYFTVKRCLRGICCIHHRHRHMLLGMGWTGHAQGMSAIRIAVQK